MSKRSNKTEQVLKLITKDGVPDEAVEETEEVKEVEKVQEKPKPEPQAKAEAKKTGYLVNLTEMLVKEKVDEIMARLNVCSCEKCRYDILALTLNSLTNKFVTSNTGRLHIQLEVYKKQSETDIIAALTRAAVRVKSSPHHD